ncbi:MAG TPA: hydroxymethylbilane synthase [Candidatus Bathyarchaeia archaeon]|nr:hydroxymethylbilane synthase [Candidatus Bathyarchaeia archaeon]
MIDRLAVGTRGSLLAITQTNQTIEALRRISPGVGYKVVVVHTQGDKANSWNETTPRKEMFTKEIEESLIKHEIDIAIHSVKDLTTNISTGLVIAAVTKRLDPRDVMITRSKCKFSQIPARAKVGTSSARRKAQLLAARADLEILELHGNVDTRIRKVRSGEYDVIVLASAGLARLGLESHVSEVISTDVMLPAVGQGALAIQCREDDEEIRDLVTQIDHRPTRGAIQAERAFARKLGADCQTPVAAYARYESARFVIEGMVAAPNGRILVRSRLTSQGEKPESVGEELASRLLAQGAQTIMEAA